MERNDIDRDLSALLDSMNEAERENMIAGISDDFKRMRQEVADIKRTLSIRQQMEPILPYISVSSLAKDYFGKSASWFYQRLNGNVVHSKAVAFTDEELDVLKNALKDVAFKLNMVTNALS